MTPIPPCAPSPLLAPSRRRRVLGFAPGRALAAAPPHPAALACIALAVFALILTATAAHAAPIYVPPDASGWPGGVIEENAPAPYLAFHKIRARQAARAGLGAAPAVATPSQRRYDARTYDLDLDLVPATHLITGSVHMRATVVDGPLSTLDLDLAASMTVDSVKAAGVTTGAAHAGAVLTVLLDRAYASGENVDLMIWYHGVPPGGGAFGTVFSFETHSGTPLIWTLSEMFGAREWWPCKDAPEDKADSVSVRVRVPSGMLTAGNGTLLSSVDDGLHATTVWKERHPIATYLVAVTSFAFTTVSDWYRPSPADSMPLNFYLFPESVAGAAAVNAKVKGMIGAYAARFGPYPFQDEKYGEVQNTWGGGMENQTLTSLGGFWESVVAHELGHQWWGDHVTCNDFHHVWLNEGFATYCEALWAESQSGLAAYHAYLENYRYYGPGTVWAPDELDDNRVFDSNLSYEKGAWLLHMLRHVMSDTLFFQALRQYGEQYAYGTATTEQFRDVCASVGGRDLTKYFDEWFYGEYYPQYGYSWASAPSAIGGYDVTVVITQQQAWQKFWMPVDVRINTGAGPRTFVAWDSLAFQPFNFHVDAAPTTVALDPDGWILGMSAPMSITAAPPPLAARLALAAPWPNPTRAGAVLAYALPQSGPARVRVYDVRGALVWEHAEPLAAAGPHQLTWDGRDHAGHAVPVGMYVVRLETSAGDASRRLAIVR